MKNGANTFRMTILPNLNISGVLNSMNFSFGSWANLWYNQVCEGRSRFTFSAVDFIFTAVT
jgi:hypothetical protein